MSRLLDKLLRRHRWVCENNGLIGVRTFACDYCYRSTYTGDAGLLPVSIFSFVEPHSKCERSKV